MILNCDSCGFSRQVPDKYAGKTVKCPKCKAGITLGPASAAGAAAVPDAAVHKDRPTGPAQKDVPRYAIAEFIEKTRQKDKGQGLFELETGHMLEVNLDGRVWMKLGTMIAYRGSIKFTREGVLEHGVKKLFKKAVTGEGVSLTKAEGRGSLYLAEQGKNIQVLNLQGEAVYVNGNDLLAFQDGIDWDIKMLKKVAGMMAGGLFNVRLEGTGMIAVTCHHRPVTLVTRPGLPVVTDPNATVMWSGSLTPDLKTDISFKTFLGRGSGESIQMRFDGDGFVVVQPFEETYFQSK